MAGKLACRGEYSQVSCVRFLASIGMFKSKTICIIEDRAYIRIETISPPTAATIGP